jgi:hypothetical protein
MNPLEAVHVANALVPLPAVLDALDIFYPAIPGQIACPFHKAGQEESPSARVFADNSLYCFTCARQYGPVDVWAVTRGCDAEVAAAVLLERWPPPEGDVRAALREWTRPRRIQVDEALARWLDDQLLGWRHRVPLTIYREWARRLEETAPVIARLPREEQPRATEHLCNQMRFAFLESQNTVAGIPDREEQTVSNP